MVSKLSVVTVDVVSQDGERGVLLFTASMTVVRNGMVQEVPFDTQTEAFSPRDKRGVTLPTVAAREAGGRKVKIIMCLTRSELRHPGALQRSKHCELVIWCVAAHLLQV